METINIINKFKNMKVLNNYMQKIKKTDKKQYKILENI